MQLKNVIASTILMASATIAMPPPTAAQDLLTGDTRLACEAILCLTTISTPDECAESFTKYFKFIEETWKEALKAHTDFLALCPLSEPTPEIQAMLPEITEEGHAVFNSNGCGRSRSVHRYPLEQIRDISR